MALPNVTPLTTAAVLLATGQSPDTLVNGSASGLGAAALEAPRPACAPAWPACWPTPASAPM